MRRAIWLSGPAEGAAVEEGEGAALDLLFANAWMSSEVMVPSGPVPRTCAMSTPSSLARRRAFGEICGGAPEGATGFSGACVGPDWVEGTLVPRAVGAAAAT